MKCIKNEQKIIKIVKNNNSNITNKNSIISDNNLLKSKCDNLFNSYDILKTILLPNVTKEKNDFMAMIFDIIKSQIILFIDILLINDLQKTNETINMNIQNLSKHITDIYNLQIINLNKNDIKDDKIHSIFNNTNQKYNSFNENNDFNNDGNKIKINLEQIDTNIHDNPIKIEIKEENQNIHNYLPLNLSKTFSSYSIKKNNFYNHHNYNKNINNKQQIKNSSLINFKTNIEKNKKNNKLYGSEKKKRNDKHNNFLLLSNSLSNVNKKRENSKINNNLYLHNKLNIKNSNKKIQSINKYQNIESKVALYLKREDEFNKKTNFLFYNITTSQNNNNKINKNDETEKQDIYQLLPTSLKQPLEDYIKKKQNFIFDNKPNINNK